MIGLKFSNLIGNIRKSIKKLFKKKNSLAITVLLLLTKTCFLLKVCDVDFHTQEVHPYNLRNCWLSPRHAVRQCLQYIGLMRVIFFFCCYVEERSSRHHATVRPVTYTYIPIYIKCRGVGDVDDGNNNSEDEISEAVKNGEPRVRALDADSLGL